MFCLFRWQAEHEVVNSGLSARQRIEVQTARSIPDAFAMLIVQVTSDLGPPVSYVKTRSANRIELVITKKAKSSKLFKYLFVFLFIYSLTSLLNCLIYLFITAAIYYL